jgi:hypothetical protein
VGGFTRKATVNAVVSTNDISSSLEDTAHIHALFRHLSDTVSAI